jgi:dTDP-4-amino-4,6-dideoxygalactose transaminase
MRVPFNDLSRIHLPLVDVFQNELKEIITENQFVLGDKVEKFEKNFASWECADYCASVSNGTVALELALRALEIGPGDEVIVPAFTFVASVFAVMQTGATPILCDVKPGIPFIDETKCEKLISNKTKAIIAVTLHGRVENLSELRKICDEHELKLILDAAQSHGARIDGKSLINYAEIATYSFYPGKNLGALGEGGAVITNNQEVFDKICLYRNWGALEKYNHDKWGGNFRMETLQAAFLNVKLGFMDSWIQERKNIAKMYIENIKSEIIPKNLEITSDHVYHIFDIRVSNRANAILELNTLGIQTGIHYPKAIHQNSFYENYGKLGKFPMSEEIAKTTLSIPIFPGLSTREIEFVVENVNKYCHA